MGIMASMYRRFIAACRIMVWLLITLPWLAVIFVAVAVDECVFRRHMLRRILWNYVSLIFPDLIEISELLKQTYGKCIYRFETLNKGEHRIVLSIDDCPGDSPIEMKLLLDVLDKYGARATFFCTTDFISKAKTIEVTRIMKMIVSRGHELGNHMPEDKPYWKLSAQQFEEELNRSEKVLYQFDRKPIRDRWFRPPMGKLSHTMMSVLERKGYRGVAMGDVFSNDVLVGGSLDPPDADIVDFHISHNIRRAKPGSIVVFHCPNLSRRRQLVPILDGLLNIWKLRGYVCCSLLDYTSHTEDKRG